MNPSSIELKVPSVGESVTEVQISEWLKTEGDMVRKDENVLVLETDKATVDLPSPIAGRLTKTLKKKGERVHVGEAVGEIESSDSSAPVPNTPPTPEAVPAKPEEKKNKSFEAPKLKQEISPDPKSAPEPKLEKLTEPESAPESVSQAAKPKIVSTTSESNEEVVPMSLLRRKIAERLVEAQHTAALLTTFNEIDMSIVIALRKENQERFQERYHAKLGFMSFFIKATVEALREVPLLNAEIRGTDIIYRNYHDIAIAIGGGRGLVVPVLRGAGRMSFAEIEKGIADFAQRVKDNKIKPDELHGGTFTITNGGIYGSLLSTPLVNPPQSGVLGMHAIQERPVAISGQVVIRPMMYIALTYDHRLVDGREAVQFLKRIKECIESPARMLIEI